MSGPGLLFEKLTHVQITLYLNQIQEIQVSPHENSFISDSIRTGFTASFNTHWVPLLNFICCVVLKHIVQHTMLRVNS